MSDLEDFVERNLSKVPDQYYKKYALYMKSQEWRAIRKATLKRDHYSCVDCDSDTKVLVVHHLHYDGVETMKFSVEQLVSLCKACHDIRHGRNQWETKEE